MRCQDPAVDTELDVFRDQNEVSIFEPEFVVRLYFRGFLLDVPASRFAAAGVDASTVVAARPEGWPSFGASSEKSSRFSAC